MNSLTLQELRELRTKQRDVLIEDEELLSLLEKKVALNHALFDFYQRLIEEKGSEQNTLGD